jgi:hypothetical protein
MSQKKVAAFESSISNTKVDSLSIKLTQNFIRIFQRGEEYEGLQVSQKHPLNQSH